MQRQQEQQITQQQQFTQQQFTQQTQQRVSRVEQHVTRQVTSQQQQQQVQGGMIMQSPSQPAFGGRPGDISPPVFEQIFRNARFAQGGNALFEGKVRGNPKPVVSWTRKGAPLLDSNKYRMTYDDQSGNVSLLIGTIGPGDEGEYTCTARNQYGEAICSVYIQPEGLGQLVQQQQGGYQKEYAQTFESSEQRVSGSTQSQSTVQRYQKQMTSKVGYANGHVVEEDFKVDTFEYRLLREVEFRESITRRFIGELDSEIITIVDRSLGPVAPPQISQKPRNSKLSEGAEATFQAKITANPKPRLTWFKNGQRITQSQKYQATFSNQQASLKVQNVGSEDSGHYTLLAENPQGCVVSSAYLAVEPSSAVDGLYENQREQTLKSTHVESTTVVDSGESGKTLAPNFVRVCSDREATEGKMSRFDCRVTGRPYPEVAWFINGRQVSDDATHKILVNESGNHALMVTNVHRSDAGVISCIARNKSGETSFQCNLFVIEKEQVVAPKFVERFTTVHVKEGEPVVLNARAVGTPVPRITWQKDGVQIAPGPNINVTIDSGASTLDIPRAKASDAAWYQCTAQNVAGSTATRARLFVETPKGSAPEPRRLNLPRPSKIIEPEPTPGPEVIYLRHVERAKPHTPLTEEERIYPPPQFIIPLSNVQQVEGGRVHFEARIEPVGDPTMRVDWFINGRPLEASSRATTTFRFGFLALDLISIILEDSGEYVCRVTSSSGSVESQALLSITGRASIEQSSQYPDSLQYIQQLEDYSRYQRTESVEETSSQRPNFIRPLQDLGELQEGRNAHFEAQLTPVSDPTMKVEWYKDGKTITASSRITTIFNFGYVSLNILHLRAEDAGTYTVRAVNRLGEAISSSTLSVYARTNVTGDLGIPEQQRYIEKVEELEAYQQQQQYKYVQEAPESTSPPEFKAPISDQNNIREGGFAHFEARLEPIGDSTLRVEWLKDGRPVEASSRITTFFNFGYVALTIKYVTTHDIGTYTCRAYNTLGQATTSANLTVVSKKDIILDSQHPGGLEKIQYLEDSSRYGRSVHEETSVTQKPRFLGPLKGTNKIVEGQRAHFEVRVEPQNDMTMVIEWYFNGRVIMSANRTQTYHDFGYVALDIVSVRSEDAGTYTVVARNALGEEQISATMEVETRSSIDTTSMHRSTYEKTQHLEGSKFVEPQYHIEEISKSKPIFVQPLSDPKPISEGKNIHLECRLEPMGDPTMRVEWFYNGRAITVGSRFRTYYDFGYVALDIVHVTSLDSGEYTVRATNHLGSAHTSACVKVISRSDILTESQNESALEQIQFLEDSSRSRRTVTEDVMIMQAPQFTRPLHNIETVEGTNVHLECRLQPSGDPSMRVDWFVNGRPVKTGHRFRPAYEFDYVALDLLSCYAVDSGVYTCQARNQLGEAVTSCSVKIIAKKDLILESQHPSGLEKIQYLEDSSRYRKTEYMDEVVNIRPHFVTKPKSLENMREGQHAHFECKLEPVTDSNLKVEWYKNGRPVTVGHRFRPIHDFGYVALDIIDLIAEDSGTYTCRAVNLVGADETTCTLSCRGTAQIVTGTQNETGLEQIQYLEDRSRYQRSEFVEEITKQAPIFTTSLKHIDIKEGQRAHFECRLIPVSDPTMKVEWFHNNVPVKSGSRFTETNNFGFVALDILYCYPEDSGTYTCRARNALGEAVTSASLNCHSKKSIYLESQHEGALNRLNYLEDSSRYQKQTVQEESVTQAPVFTQPMRDIKVAENQAAHFEARLIPVGDPKLRVEWLRNGVPIQASNRVTTMHDFGYVALNMKYVYPEDSGTYTCRAINELGQAVTSSSMVVHSKASLLLESQHEGALQKLQVLEDSSRYQRREEEEIIVTQPPRFTAQLNGPTNLAEGQSAHYECRIEPYPDPNMKVEWYHNGQPLQTGHRFRTTYDFGFAALDILTVYGEDSGEYTCKATNRLGQASSSIKVNVKSRSSIILETQHEGALQKIQYLEDDSRHKRTTTEEAAIAEKPQFGRPLRNVEHLPEGQSAHLEATLTPVNDPTMKVEWFCNGRPIPQGHRFKTTYDFGFVALDILYAYAEDSGTYMCRARNAVGEAVTTCSVKVEAKAGLYLDTLDEQRLKKIRDLESYERPQKEDIEPQAQKPVFITPLNNLEHLKEGEHAHLECRVEPINDPNLKIEWFVNGVAIKTGHRFRTTHDFGYVALDILYSYAEDSGTYMCKATNLLGEAVNTCTINVGARRSIYLESQHPEGLQKIQELEAQGHHGRLEIEEPVPTPPRFVTELRGTTELVEGQTAHFEAQVEPLHDPNLRIEFYHNGKPLPSASRFHITFDFGYLALDIGHVVPEDAGEYTAKAINALGQCTSSISIKVQAKGSIILESQRPEGLEKIRQLEGQAPFQRPEIPEPTRQRPVFTQPLQNIDALAEGQTAHFECRLIPVGDPTLKVEWFRNEKPLETSSRITKTHDFGFVALDMTHVRGEDEGVYMCRASNPLGEAVTTASMKIRTKASIQLETQHPEGMRKIKQLEEGRAPVRPDEPDRAFEKPIFTQVLTGPSELWEGQKAHFECRVVPVGDPSLRFEWYINGVELKMGSRFHVTHDFGFVTLDINSVITEDAGVYMCKAINQAGEAVSSTSLKVKSRSSIVGEPLQPDAWQKIQLKEAEMNRVPEMFVDTTPQQAPVFTTHLKSYDKLVEGQHVLLEAQVEPRADPNLRIEWFKNGVTLTTGTRLRSTFDFGLVTLNVNGLRPDDSAIYTCKATNLLGEAVSTCTIKVEDRHWLLGSSLRPDALPFIEALEEPKGGQTETAEPVYESPVYITHLNNVECKEGDAVHFECHVEPSKDPTLNIEWFVNGKPLPSGARFKSTYDFGYVALDINHAYDEDSGVYMCKATNSKGQAVTSGTLKCTSEQNIYLDTQHPQGKAGLDAVQEADDAAASKLQRQASGPEQQYPKPVFIVPLQPEFSLGERDPLHLECQVEPKEDPNLKIEWYFNGKALEHGSRFKMTCDFGFVTLDLTDVYERDQGIYTCKAHNLRGEAFTSTTIYCSSKTNLIEHTQHPKGAEGLEKIQDLEESLRRQEGGPAEGDDGHPPEFTSQFQNLSNLSEGEIAHFEASLTPVGDQTMVVEWFYNGEVLKASHRIRTVHAFGMVVLEILGTKIEDSGTYTCRATNKWGRAEISVELECVEKSKGQKPQFTTQIQSLEGLKDGESAHFECTLIPVGDPNLKVEWFHNGQPIRHSSRMKSVSDFGFVVMDISYVQSHDSGEYVCRASNRYGEDFTKATIKCKGKGGVYLDSLQPDSLARIRELEVGQGGQTPSPTTPVLEPPVFTTHISDITKLVEGQSAHFEARLTPVNDPNLTVEWFYNGKKLPHGHRYRTFHDFGIVILDILYCYEENSGVYECRAVNRVGQDVTKATLKCVSKANLILDSQLPRGMEGGLEKIQTLEDSLIRTRDERTTETKGQAPVFTVPLSNIDSLREGENAHFEARLIPTDDPKLKVEWFWNGKPLKTGSRFRTFCDFGFVILEISPVYPEDSGEYSCRAFNDYGQAVTTASMKVQGKRSIILESQLPKGMEHTIEKIAELEGLGSAPGQSAPDEDSGKPPEFITTPADLTLIENSLAHFECRLTPVNDPSMRVEWFHNGKALSAGSRIKTINDFGFVILEVAGVYQRDSGLYTCKATNRHGEATVSCKLQVRGRQGIILEPQLPSNFRTGTESIQKLEEALYKRDEILTEEEKPNPPRFVVELKDVDVVEGGKIHFDCRVEPVGDSSMRIDWFHNGRPFATGSRVHMLNDFGFIVLDMDYTYARDSGEYICRATNKWGSATTKASLTCKAKHDIVLDSQLPQGMSGEKLKELERGPVTQALREDAPLSPPKFITQITSVGIGEGERVHFECRVEPRHDPKLRVEWYRNGKPLPTGHRFRTVYDLGFVSLDILYTYPEDSGEYVCRAVNDLGEDTTRATISCKKLPTIILQNQVPKGMKKSEALMQMEATIKKYTSEIHLTEDDLYDIEKKQPPRFVTQILDQTSLVEMQSTKFECQLAPVGDPNMKVEWFLNGKPLPHKNRFTPIYDFGYVAMNFGWVYPEDSGEYLCRATNLYGMDETRAIIKTAGKPGIIYESQLPKGMKSIERIREMEAAWQIVPEEAEETSKPKVAPAFVTKPEPFTAVEGESARFCCRVTGFPRPRVMWVVNGHTVVNGTRYKLTYDGMWHLDIPKTRQYDNGKVEVVARNSAGEAVAVTDLTVKPRGDDYRGVLKNSPRRIVGTKEYRKPEWVSHMEELQEQLRATQCVPTFVQDIVDARARETESVTFECQYSGTPAPDVVWYKDDKMIRSSKNVQIKIFNNRTSCTVVRATPEDEGTYLCKATSDIGVTTTKAKLYVQEITEEERREFEIKHAKEEEEERIRLEKVKIEKAAELKKKRRGLLSFETEGRRESTDVREVQVLESTSQFTESIEQVKAKTILSVQDSVEVSAIASCKKVDETVQPMKIPGEKAQKIVPVQESVTVSEIQTEDTVKDLKQRKTKKAVESEVKPKESAQQREIRERKEAQTKQILQIKKAMQKKKVEIAEKILEEEKTKIATEVEDLMSFIQAKEFGPGESPLRDLARIGFLVRRGVAVNEITTLYQADRFPALQTPVAQSALVQLVEREGHGALISQVLTEETTTDDTHVGETVGFRAFMRMVELKHAAVEEVITHFAPEDFKPIEWESQEAVEVTSRDVITGKAKVVKQTEVQEKRKEIRKKTKTRHEEEIEGEITVPSLQGKEQVRPSLTSQRRPLIVEAVASEEREEPFKDEVTAIQADAVITTREEAVAQVSEPMKRLKKKKQEPKKPKSADERTTEDIIGDKATDSPVLTAEEDIVEESPIVSIEKKPKETKPKDKKPLPEKLVPQLMKIERKEIKPTKIKVIEVAPKEEVPLFAQVKLRKSSVQKREIKTAEVPKVLLKSNLKVIDYPPMEHTPIITEINAKPDRGILSRNTQEALKLQKRKIKRVKMPGKEEIELEEPESFEIEEDEKPITQEEEPEKGTWERMPKKQEIEEIEPQKLILGKGKVPKPEEITPEDIKLRKIPEKPQEVEKVEELKPKKQEPEEKKLKDTKEKRKLEGISPFKGKDIEDHDLELEKYEKVEPEKPEDEVPEETKIWKPTPKKPEPEPEIVQIPLKLGVPKKPPPEEEEGIKLRYKVGEPEPEIPDVITLKPFKKEKPKDEPEEKELAPPKPKFEDKPEDDVDFQLKLKPEKSKIKKPKPEKPAEEIPEPEEIVEAKFEVPEKEKPTEDIAEEFQITQPKKLKPKEPEEEEISEAVTLKPKKPKKPVVEEVAEEITLKKITPEEPKEEEITEAVTLKTKKPKKPVVEEVAEEITIKKIKPVEPEEEEEEVSEAVILKPRKPKPAVVEEIADEITLKKIKPQEPKEEEEVSEEITIKKKKPKKPIVEEAAEEITIQKFIPEKVIGEDDVDAGPVIEQPEDIAEEFTIAKRAPPRKPSIEEISEEITLKQQRPKKPSLPEVTEVTEVMIRPRITKTKEEIEQEFKIQLQTYQEEDISMSSRVRLKKQKPMTYAEETGEQTIRITQEVEDEGPEEIVEIVEEVPEDEDVYIELKRKPSYSYRVEEPDEEEMVKLSRPRTKKPPEPAQDIQENFKVKLRQKQEVQQTSYSVEDVEEEFKIGLKREVLEPRGSLYEEESLALKLKAKRKPSQTLHQEAVSLSITRETEVFEEGVEEVVVTEYEEGDRLYSLCSYVAENEDAINLVEGERVYVLESHNSDWWFVKKHLTEEKGFVPAQLLMDEPSYTLYVQKKLHEKIDKLPVFEKPSSGDKVSAPRFIEKLQPKHTPDGTTVQFECQVEGNPRPLITWFRQTAIILPSVDFQIFYDEDNVATLIVKEVFPEDAGTYTCVAKNAAGFASSSTELIVEAPLSDHGSDTTLISRKSLSRESSLADILEGIPPMFSRKPKARCVDEGTNVELECRLVAVPEPDIIWYFAGKELKTKENVTVITESDMHSYTSIVKIKKVKKNQEGSYAVVAKNREGEASVSLTLKVMTGDKEPPQILEPLRSNIIREGDNVQLSTQIVGNPPPKIVWMKDDSPVTNLPTHSDGVTHTLTLLEASPEDTGIYTVAAKNPVGSAETTATLIVDELPGEKLEPPLFVERFQEEKVPEKGTLRLVAKVTGNPVPKITWLRNNRPLKPSSTVKQSFDGEDIVLEITSIDSEVDAGDYKCVASNPVGKASHGAQVTVDVPKVYFTKQLEEVVDIEEQETLCLECETSHTVSTKWFHNNKEVSGMDHRMVMQEGRTHRLVIKKTMLRDAGSYKCTVKKQSTGSTVTVHETKPEFVRKLQDFEVKERELAILEVEVSSEMADVTWHKDGEQLNEIDDRFVFEKQGMVRKLLIRGASVHDEGEYTCALGELECTADVTVVELPPEIINKMQDVTIAKGEKATFEIELTKGDALVRWFKDGKELQFSEHVQLSIDGKRQKLKVYNSELEDSGEYSCQVGEQMSVARLTVEEPVVEFITRLPDVTLIPLNTDASFTVELSRPNVEVKWLKKGKEIKPSDRYIITSDGAVRKLVIKKVTLEDQTDYTCVAVNVKTSSKLKVEIIETAPRINLDALVRKYKVKKGEDVNIEAKYSATPQATDEWSVNGTVITKSKRVIPTLTESSASLTIKKVEETDVGSYTIKLSNNCGEASADLTLILMEVPSQPGIPEVIEVTNETITLHWKAPESDGNSPITNYILEYHDKSDFTWIKANEDFNIVETTHKVTQLRRNVEYMFRVTAVNEVGPSPPSHNTRYIKITAPVNKEPPSIQEPLKGVVCGLKQSVTLSCVIGGIPEPEIKWLRDGKVFKNKSITYENRIAKYVIIETTETSSSTYSCQARNEVGFAETSCELKIQEPPKIEYDENVTSQKLRVTNQWKIEIKFSGYPKPDVSWTKNNKSLASTKHCTIHVDESSSTIAIYSLSKGDTGTYTFTARNEAGSASVEFSLRVIDKPSKPEGPMIVKDIRKESVVIEWKPPRDDGGLELSKYSVEKCDVEKMVWMKVADVEKDVSSYCVQRLKEDAEYMFRVIAENPVGISEALESDTVAIRSKFDKPSPPRGPLGVSGMTETSFTVTWQPPESDGGAPILEYIVERREVGKKAWQKVGSSTGEITHIEASALKANVSYHFRITARNDVGLSLPFAPEDPITAGKRISAPSAPTNLTVVDITSKSVTLQWGPPASTGGTELTGYIIENRLASAKQWSKVVTLETSVTQYCIENLKEKSEFYFRVYAENSIGLSPPAATELVSLKTHASPPSPPTAPLEIRSIGPYSIVIEWGTPESDGGAPLEGYTIAIRDIRKSMWMEVGRVKEDVQKLAIKDLQENHEYLIRIFARNEVGLSEPLESEEPFKVLKPTEMEQLEIEKLETTAPTLSFSTETSTSWLREAGMDADIRSYARGSLLRRDEYFFRIWYYARQLFK